MTVTTPLIDIEALHALGYSEASHEREQETQNEAATIKKIINRLSCTGLIGACMVTGSLLQPDRSVAMGVLGLVATLPTIFALKTWVGQKIEQKSSPAVVDLATKIWEKSSKTSLIAIGIAAVASGLLGSVWVQPAYDYNHLESSASPGRLVEQYGVEGFTKTLRILQSSNTELAKKRQTILESAMGDYMRTVGSKPGATAFNKLLNNDTAAIIRSTPVLRNNVPSALQKTYVQIALNDIKYTPSTSWPTNAHLVESHEMDAFIEKVKAHPSTLMPHKKQREQYTHSLMQLCAHGNTPETKAVIYKSWANMTNKYIQLNDPSHSKRRQIEFGPFLSGVKDKVNEACYDHNFIP